GLRGDDGFCGPADGDRQSHDQSRLPRASILGHVSASEMKLSLLRHTGVATENIESPTFSRTHDSTIVIDGSARRKLLKTDVTKSPKTDHRTAARTGPNASCNGTECGRRARVPDVSDPRGGVCCVCGERSGITLCRVANRAAGRRICR